MKTQVVHVDLTTEKGLKDAEREKSKLENQGYRLVNETVSFTFARLYYVLD